MPDANEEGGVRYPCADGSAIFIYFAPENAGRSQSTVAGWFVDDLDGTIMPTNGTPRVFLVERHDIIDPDAAVTAARQTAEPVNSKKRNHPQPA